jgi:hypothetical protein
MDENTLNDDADLNSSDLNGDGDSWWEPERPWEIFFSAP